eukprot:2716111-Pleurochrysis_carterae.AAC.2
MATAEPDSNCASFDSLYDNDARSALESRGPQTRSTAPCPLNRVCDDCDERGMQRTSELAVTRRRRKLARGVGW